MDNMTGYYRLLAEKLEHVHSQLLSNFVNLQERLQKKQDTRDPEVAKFNDEVADENYNFLYSDDNPRYKALDAAREIYKNTPAGDPDYMANFAKSNSERAKAFAAGQAADYDLALANAENRFATSDVNRGREQYPELYDTPQAAAQTPSAAQTPPAANTPQATATSAYGPSQSTYVPGPPAPGQDFPTAGPPSEAQQQEFAAGRSKYYARRNQQAKDEAQENLARINAIDMSKQSASGRAQIAVNKLRAERALKRDRFSDEDINRMVASDTKERFMSPEDKAARAERTRAGAAALSAAAETRYGPGGGVTTIDRRGDNKIQGTNMTFNQFKERYGRDYNALSNDDANLVRGAASNFAVGRVSQSAQQAAQTADAMNQAYATQNAELRQREGQLDRAVDASQIELDRFRNDPQYRDKVVQDERNKILSQPGFIQGVVKDMADDLTAAQAQKEAEEAEAAAEYGQRAIERDELEVDEEDTANRQAREKEIRDRSIRRDAYNVSPLRIPGITPGEMGPPSPEDTDNAMENEWREAMGIEPLTPRELTIRKDDRAAWEADNKQARRQGGARRQETYSEWRRRQDEERAREQASRRAAETSNTQRVIIRPNGLPMALPPGMGIPAPPDEAPPIQSPVGGDVTQRASTMTAQPTAPAAPRQPLGATITPPRPGTGGMNTPMSIEPDEQQTGGPSERNRALPQPTATPFAAKPLRGRTVTAAARTFNTRGNATRRLA